MKWKTLYLAECRHWLTSPLFWLSYVLLMIAPAIAFLGTLGVFDPGSAPDLSGRTLNAPLELYGFLHFFQPVLLAGAALITGHGWYRDFQSEFHHLIAATPVSRFQYWSARATASWTLVILWATAPGFGLWAAEHWPGLPLGDHQPGAYLGIYGLYLWPNVTMASMAAFLLVRWTREITLVFIGLVVFWVYQQVVGMMADWYVWLDPTGHSALQQAARSWEPGDNRSGSLPITTTILGNRLGWLGVWSLLFVGVNPWLPVGIRDSKKRAFTWPRFEGISTASVTGLLLSNLLGRLRYYAIILAGMALYAMVLQRTLHRPEIDLLPYLPLLVSAPLTLLSQVWLGVIILVTHHLAYMDTRSGMRALIGATAATNGQLWMVRFQPLCMIAALLTLLSITVGLVSQWLLGPVPISPGAWLQYGLFLGSYMLIWATLALSIQWLIPSPYVGLLLVGGLWLLGEAVAAVGWSSPLWAVGGPAYVPYSDWLGFREAGTEALALRIFWIGVSGCLVVVATWKRNRKYDEDRWFSLAFAKKRMPRTAVIVLLALLCLTAGFGYWIQKRANHAQTISNPDQNEYRERYEGYAHVPQPTIQHLDLELAFFPEEGCFRARGSYCLRNEEDMPLDTILVQMGYDEITDFHLSVPADTVKYDPEFQVLVLRLEDPLPPGKEITALFDIRNRPNRLFDRYLQVTSSVSFLGQDILPRFTFLAKADTLNPNQHYQGGDADRITWSVRLSSEPDQSLLAPGKLLEEGKNANRSYAQFRSERTGKLSFGFLSGRFRRSIVDDSLEVWYHPQHEVLVPHVHTAQRTGLSFLTNLYGPYDYAKSQVVAFPRALGTHATAYAQMLPLSEVRWWADTITTGFFLPGYMVMHELAHHWWGQQLLPASGPGATFLTESMAEYLSLGMLEKGYGKQAMEYFLQLQRDRYLRGHRSAKEEPPLLQVETGQQYLAYAKGALTLRTLAAYLGQDNLDQVMHRFLAKHRYGEAPYPTAEEWMDELVLVTPDSLLPIVQERLERVLIHQVTLQDVQIRSEREGFSTLELELSHTKHDENEPIYRGAAEWLEIEAYDERGQLIAQQRWWLAPGQHRIEWEVPEETVRITLDPNLLLLEEDRSDNTFLLK